MPTVSNKKVLQLDAILITVVVIILLIGLFFVSDTFQIFLHAVVNLFAGGRTPFKAFFFLVYLLFLVILMTTSSYGKSKSISALFKIVIFLIFILAYLFNLYSFLLFSNQYHLRLTDSVIVFNEVELSSTSLLHNHVLKGVTGLLLKLTGIKEIENLDGGMVFIDFMPPFIFYIGIFMLIFLLLLVFWLYYQTIHHYNSIKTKLTYTLIYGILTYSLLKNFLDGGIFNYEAIVSLGFLMTILFFQKRVGSYFPVILISLYLLANLLFFHLHLFTNYATQTEGLVNNVWVTLSYSGLTVILIYYLKKGRLDRLGVLSTILVGCLLFYPIFRDLSILKYRATVIKDEQTAIVGIYTSPNDSRYRYLDAVGELYFYEISSATPVTAGEIINQFHLLDNFYPISFPWQNCLPHGLWDQYSFELISLEKFNPQNTKENIIQIDKFQELSKNKGIYEYAVSLSIKPCYPRLMNIVQEFLKKQGLRHFMVKNIEKGVRQI